MFAAHLEDQGMHLLLRIQLLGWSTRRKPLPCHLLPWLRGILPKRAGLRSVYSPQLHLGQLHANHKEHLRNDVRESYDEVGINTLTLELSLRCLEAFWRHEPQDRKGSPGDNEEHKEVPERVRAPEEARCVIGSLPEELVQCACHDQKARCAHCKEDALPDLLVIRDRGGYEAHQDRATGVHGGVVRADLDRLGPCKDDELRLHERASEGPFQVLGTVELLRLHAVNLDHEVVEVSDLDDAYKARGDADEHANGQARRETRLLGLHPELANLYIVAHAVPAQDEEHRRANGLADDIQVGGLTDAIRHQCRRKTLMKLLESLQRHAPFLSQA
mmetsp:Transcript_39277/g.88282  ORF Transcript_39277/g.88282 Transcript_39277/m.88282 type:complete len:331 (+) Transcript_39277:758-1750(+)